MWSFCSSSGSSSSSLGSFTTSRWAVYFLISKTAASADDYIFLIFWLELALGSAFAQLGNSSTYLGESSQLAA